jgi:hypothetical protein
MIDLLRLRISKFRQDRILDELFLGKNVLLTAVKALHDSYKNDPDKSELFNDFEDLAKSTSSCHREFTAVLHELRRRLRRDTEVILRLKEPKFSGLFESQKRISFQNRLLVYLVYKCGGFFPTNLEEKDIVKQHGISSDCIVRRHGTHRDKQLERLLSPGLYAAVDKVGDRARPDASQPDRVMWPGGYFGYPGALKDIGLIEDEGRRDWRKEYLPGPTALLGAAFCGLLVGALRNSHSGTERLRVTLHRAMPIGDEELLQQACEYQGVSSSGGAARTFPKNIATIGLAYRTRRIVRSKIGVDGVARPFFCTRMCVGGTSVVASIPRICTANRRTTERRA